MTHVDEICLLNIWCNFVLYIQFWILTGQQSILTVIVWCTNWHFIYQCFFMFMWQCAYFILLIYVFFKTEKKWTYFAFLCLSWFINFCWFFPNAFDILRSRPSTIFGRCRCLQHYYKLQFARKINQFHKFVYVPS